MRIQILAVMATWAFLGVKASDGEGTAIEVEFDTQSKNVLNSDTPSYASYTIKKADTATTSLYLIQVTWINNTPSGQPVPSLLPSVQKAGKLQDYCIAGGSKIPCQGSPVTVDVKQTIGYNLSGLVAAQNTSDRTLSYSYALCFTNPDGRCGASSVSRGLSLPPFTSDADKISFDPSIPLSNWTLLSVELGNISNNPIDLSPTTSSGGAETSYATISATPTNTITPAPVPVETGRKSGLSVGAKVGIAVGAVALLLAILILALLFLRKKHRQKSHHERLMLNQSLNADSRDLITEKEVSPVSYQIPTLNFASPDSPTSQTRHSALSPYDSIASQPYNGSAASIPRRKATLSTATASSVAPPPVPSEPVAATIPISREVSSASSHLPPSRSISTTTPPPQSRNYEQYRDIPPYGHASPQVYQGGLQAPFLSETDSDRGGSIAMTDADHTRLTEEEEERRIDAAIAESERLKSAQGR